MTTQKTGRPRFEPTPEQRETVEFYAAAGIPHEIIAKILTKAGTKCSYGTLRKYFKEELELGLHTAVGNVASVLYAEAMKSQPWAVCFFLKTRGKWRETNVLEVEGSSTAAPTIAISFANGGPGFGAPAGSMDEETNAGAGDGTSQPEA